MMLIIKNIKIAEESRIRTIKPKIAYVSVCVEREREREFYGIH